MARRRKRGGAAEEQARRGRGKGAARRRIRTVAPEVKGRRGGGKGAARQRKRGGSAEEKGRTTERRRCMRVFYVSFDEIARTVGGHNACVKLTLRIALFGVGLTLLQLAYGDRCSSTLYFHLEELSSCQ